MTCMLVLSGRVELLVMHGGVKNKYEINVVVMNLPLCPQTADDIDVSLVKSVQSALSDLKRPPEHLQSQCNYPLFIT